MGDTLRVRYKFRILEISGEKTADSNIFLSHKKYGGKIKISVSEMIYIKTVPINNIPINLTSSNYETYLNDDWDDYLATDQIRH